MSGAFSRICTRPYTIILTVRVWVLAGMILNKLDRHGHTTSIPTPRKGFPLVAALEQTAVHNSAHCRRGGAEKRWNRSVKVEKGAIPHTHRRGRAHVHTRMSTYSRWTWMWPLSKCTRCYVTTCLLWTPVGVRVVDDETRVKYLEEGRAGGAAFAGCVP